MKIVDWNDTSGLGAMFVGFGIMIVLAIIIVVVGALL